MYKLSATAEADYSSTVLAVRVRCVLDQLIRSYDPTAVPADPVTYPTRTLYYSNSRSSKALYCIVLVHVIRLLPVFE